MLIKNVILTLSLLLLFGICFDLKAQIKVDYLATVGYPAGFKSEVAHGVHLGFNPYFETTLHRGIEMQISYLYAKVNTYFISFNNTSIRVITPTHSATVMGGLRVYLTKRKRKVQVYTNLLLGAYYFEENFSQPVFSETKLDEFGFGLSSGLFLQLKKEFTIGFSVEKPDFLIGRVGYNF